MNYERFTANYPKQNTDVLFNDIENTYKYSGIIDEAMHFTEEKQLFRTDLWKRFVNQFKEDDADYDAGWRGEYWGKMMRGACFVYAYSRDEKLYDVLTETVIDMMSAADENGRISSYNVSHEFDGWDIWGRKYVMLGMQYYLEICKDEELKKRITASMCAQADYIMSKIGREEGKKSITSATRHWRGLNSSSILEPFVRLYSITENKKYLDFAEYIVEIGGTEVENIFELAYQNELYPYQYPITKAYEMTSCFEGLLEYYRITKNEHYKTSLVNFADKVLESDFTVIGCCGCTHELFDHSTVRQTNTTNGKIVQETCVTVTLMKYFYQMTLITGNSKYADAFETSLYNAYLGAFNTEDVIEPTIERDFPECHLEPLPFDSYSPLTAGTRGNGVGGHRVMSDKYYYGCCAAIGAAGIGLVPKMQIMSYNNGFAMNLYINGEANTKTSNGNKVTFVTDTEYPKNGNIKITVKTEKSCDFEVMLRNPAWSKKTKVSVCGKNTEMSKGYIKVSGTWSDGDEIMLELDMRTEAIYPVPYGQQVLMNKVIWGVNYVVSTFDKEDPIAKKHIALRRGPLMLAQENRLGYSVDEPVEIKVNADGYVDIDTEVESIAPYKNILEAGVPLADGSVMHVTDYSSAGKLWTEKSKMAVWFLTK